MVSPLLLFHQQEINDKIVPTFDEIKLLMVTHKLSPFLCYIGDTSGGIGYEENRPTHGDRHGTAAET